MAPGSRFLRRAFIIAAGLGAFVPVQAADDVKALGSALTHFVSFDRDFDADFSKGDRNAYAQGRDASSQSRFGDAIRLEPGAGRFGGALRVTKKNPVRPYFRSQGILDYKTADWSGTVSIWLKLTPDEDLEPGYCDPVQIVGGDSKKGFIFLEWSRDERPRLFRYAVRPLMALWNPQNLDWAKMPDADKPMVQVERAPFSRTRWTHTVFSFDRLNSGKAAVSKLYLDGKLQGAIKDRDMTLDWDAEKVQLVLAAAYVGDMDELAVFNRALTDREVAALYKLPSGVGGLLKK